MKHKLWFVLVPLVALTGCETLQTPQQRQNAAVRQQAAARHSEERFYRLQGQIESIEMENARLMQELQKLQNEVRSYNGQISQLNASMKSLESKQARETQEVINRVEGLLKKTAAARPSAPARGAGREHVVESGHTLSAIASAYGTSVSAIKKANNLKSDSIYVGQKLFIPQ
ncbi:LysM peptidoglycan-binding domain-containing protein [Pontiella sulfatireligans]|nr:LysM peptidoglycan-binding domain-containing protein [Pontiella sulfatireligans]